MVEDITTTEEFEIDNVKEETIIEEIEESEDHE